MTDVDDDLLEFSNPAPTLATSNDFGTRDGHARHGTKRRLPLRADVNVDGHKYKGRRVSRADVALDTSTLGIDAASDPPAPTDGNDESDTQSGDDSLEHSADEDDSRDVEESGDNEGDETQPWRDETQRKEKKPSKMEVEERAIAQRLVSIQKADEKRAVAVKKQKVRLHFSPLTHSVLTLLDVPLVMTITQPLGLKIHLKQLCLSIL